MDSAILGVVLDASVLIAAERRKLTAAQAIEDVQQIIGEVPVVLSAVTVAEVGHGIYRAGTSEIRHRRRMFLDDLKAAVPVYPLTDSTAEIVARVGAEQAAKGVNLPLADLLIGACALELGYAIGATPKEPPCIGSGILANWSLDTCQGPSPTLAASGPGADPSIVLDIGRRAA